MNIHTVFAHRPAFRTVVQLKAPLEITAPASQLVNLRHVGVGFAPPGPPGSNGATYAHTQSIAGSGWTVAHNLNRHPSITTTDNLGNVIYGDVAYVDANIVQITHGSALIGFAYCN